MRHAQAAYDEITRETGLFQQEAPLTNEGAEQCAELAVAFRDLGIRFNAVVISPAKRARATAWTICGDFLMHTCDDLWPMPEVDDLCTSMILDFGVTYDAKFFERVGELFPEVITALIDQAHQTVSAIVKWVPRNGRVLVIGHQPYLASARHAFDQRFPWNDLSLPPCGIYKFTFEGAAPPRFISCEEVKWG